MNRPEAIRIRIAERERAYGPESASPSPRESFDPRESFWAVARGESQSNETVASSEARLCREFGHSLRGFLLRELSEPIRALDSEIFRGSFRDFEDWMFKYIDGPSSFREKYGYQFAEAFSRLLEQRQQLLRESESLRRVQERLTAAAGVTFATKIAGYSSLNLDLSVGSFSQVAKAFESDFESFRIFLEAFAPAAFAGVFTQDAADRLVFTVDLPASVERAFHAGCAEASAPVEQPLPAKPEAARASTSRERAEWLWRLANGSLLVPVLLALFVMWQGMKLLSEAQSAQFEALKPLLEHHLKLLEEDRRRLLGSAEPTTSPGQAPAAATAGDRQ